MTRLTMRRLRAIEGALSALLAGPEGVGDWPEDVTWEDADAAHNWVCDEMDRRIQKSLTKSID